MFSKLLQNSVDCENGSLTPRRYAQASNEATYTNRSSRRLVPGNINYLDHNILSLRNRTQVCSIERTQESFYTSMGIDLRKDAVQYFCCGSSRPRQKSARRECLTPGAKGGNVGMGLCREVLGERNGGKMDLSRVIREIKREKPGIRKGARHQDLNSKAISQYDRGANDSEAPKYRPQKMLDGSEISSQELGTFMNELNMFARYKRSSRKSRKDLSFTFRRDSSATLPNPVPRMRTNAEHQRVEKRPQKREVSPLGRFINPVC